MNLKTLKGFTLVEVLIALSIMAISFIAVLGLHYSSLSIDIRTKYEVRALDRANTCIERLRAKGFPLSNGTDTVDASYPVAWTVTPTPGEPKLCNVDLVVTWTEQEKILSGARKNETRTLRLSTVIADLR